VRVVLIVEVVERKSMQHLGEEEIYKPFLEQWSKGLNNDGEDDTRSSLISTDVPCCPSRLGCVPAGGR
jgi:hypothetical protein